MRYLDGTINVLKIQKWDTIRDNTVINSAEKK